MGSGPGKYLIWFRSMIILTLAVSFTDVYSQNAPVSDSLKKIPNDVINKITNILTIFSQEMLLSIPASIVPTPVEIKDKNLLFFDSLKLKASRNHLTKRLYSFVVINTDTTFKKHFNGPSDAGYSSFSGKRIRKISIQRLNVFKFF